MHSHDVMGTGHSSLRLARGARLVSIASVLAALTASVSSSGCGGGSGGGDGPAETAAVFERPSSDYVVANGPFSILERVIGPSAAVEFQVEPEYLAGLDALAIEPKTGELTGVVTPQFEGPVEVTLILQDGVHSDTHVVTIRRPVFHMLAFGQSDPDGGMYVATAAIDAGIPLIELDAPSGSYPPGTLLSLGYYEEKGTGRLLLGVECEFAPSQPISIRATFAEVVYDAAAVVTRLVDAYGTCVPALVEPGGQAATFLLPTSAISTADSADDGADGSPFGLLLNTGWYLSIMVSVTPLAGLADLLVSVFPQGPSLYQPHEESDGSWSTAFVIYGNLAVDNPVMRSGQFTVTGRTCLVIPGFWPFGEFNTAWLGDESPATWDPLIQWAMTGDAPDGDALSPAGDPAFDGYDSVLVYLYPTHQSLDDKFLPLDAASIAGCLEIGSFESPGNVYAFESLLDREFWPRATANTDASVRLDLVCHSMGGLIARDYLQLLASRADEAAEAHLAACRAVVTLATPHAGTESWVGLTAAVFDAALTWVVGIDLLSMNSIRDMLPCSSYLDDLNGGSVEFDTDADDNVSTGLEALRCLPGAIRVLSLGVRGDSLAPEYSAAPAFLVDTCSASSLAGTQQHSWRRYVVQFPDGAFGLLDSAHSIVHDALAVPLSEVVRDVGIKYGGAPDEPVPEPEAYSIERILEDFLFPFRSVALPSSGLTAGLLNTVTIETSGQASVDSVVQFLYLGEWLTVAQVPQLGSVAEVQATFSIGGPVFDAVQFGGLSTIDLRVTDGFHSIVAPSVPIKKKDGGYFEGQP